MDPPQALTALTFLRLVSEAGVISMGEIVSHQLDVTDEDRFVVHFPRFLPVLPCSMIHAILDVRF